MIFAFEDIAFLLELLELDSATESLLHRANVCLNLSEEQVVFLNDACIARLQELGLDVSGVKSREVV